MTARGLQIDDDPRFQAREFTVNQVAYWLMAAIVVAGALGVFGLGGPLSSKSAEAAGGALKLRYQRVAHVETPTDFEVEVAPALQKDGRFALLLPDTLLEQADVERVTPTPQSNEVRPEGHVHVFAVSGTGPAHVRYALKPRRSGRLTAAIAGSEGADGPRVPVAQFVLP